MRRSVIGLAGLGIIALTVSGCASDSAWGRLGYPEPATEEGERILLPFWQNSWIAAWIVGAITWGLILWAIVAYRRRQGDGLPHQLRYHAPLEVLYTFMPVVIIAVMSIFTVRDSNELIKLTTPEHTVNVVGFKWAWTFNYVDESAFDVGTPQSISTLWLPVDERVRFKLTAADVIHDFWVPAFLFKMDVVPGRANEFELTPNRVGSFAGKCAEFCGQGHSQMLFAVKVVTRAEYDAHIGALKAAGQGGLLETGRIVTTGVQGGGTSGTG